MRMIWCRSNVCRTPVALVGLLLAISLMFMTGCGVMSKSRRETKQLYKGLNGSKGICKKIMVFLPFENDVQWLSTDLEASFAPKLKNAIQKDCSHVRIILPEDPNFPDRFNRTPRLPEGAPNSADLAADGRASGVNLVLSGRLVDIRHRTEDRGMFWFAKVAQLARLQVVITVYHTGTGAKLLDKTIFKDIEISEDEASLIDAGQIPGTAAFPEALTDIAKTTGKAICNVLSHIPWEGYVVNVKDSQVVLSAGEASGLKKGMTLNVYKAHEEMGEEGGPDYFSLEKTTGAIAVTAVYPDHSDAAIKVGGPILPGSIVRIH